MSYIDLHTHSTASDGADTPSELVENAHKKGLSAIALTDHDTLDGLVEAREAARDLNIELVRGCEISVSADIGEVHILGFWVPEKADKLESFLSHMREKRCERNSLIIKKLQKQGFQISEEELRENAQGSIGRPHMARILLEKGYVSTINDAFDKYLGKGGSAYVPRAKMDPVYVVKLLSGLGATVAIAHPLLNNVPADKLESFIYGLMPYGLDALEAWHSAHDEAKTRQVIKLAKRFNLGLTGGSDYHGVIKPDIALGEVGTGERISGEILENLKNLHKQKGLPC